MRVNKKSKIFIAGHNGMVGSAIKKLNEKGYKKIITIDKKKLDLINQKKVFDFLKKKSQILLLLQLLKLEASWQIIHIKVNLFTKIYKFKTI